MIINEKSTVKDILEFYPEVFHVFITNGFKADSIESFIESIGERTMLKSIMRVRNINTELFINQLENEINLTINEKRYLLSEVELNEKLDFYGSIIYPIKAALKEDIETITEKHYKETGELFKCYIRAGGKSKEYAESLWKNPSIESFPNIFSTKEFNYHLGKEFRENLVDKGHFKGDFFESVNKDFQGSGIVDPKGHYCVYSVIPIVFLIDKSILGELPVPKTNEDILNPIYKDNIIVCGKEKDVITSPIFLYFYKEFGEEGLEKLAHNVKGSTKSAELFNLVSGKSGDKASIYVMPWFFAKTCYKKNFEVIWPEDGAMILPKYMLVKKKSIDKVKSLIDYNIGKDFGEICAKANMPSLNKEVENFLPNGAKLKWLGWDYIRENDVIEIEEKCERIFMKEWNKKFKGETL